MSKYIIRRLLSVIPVLIGISIFVFLIMHLTPGDPARLMLGESAPADQLEALRQELGLNDPLPIQYFNWMKKAVRLDFGRSLRSKKLVTSEIMERLPATGELAILAVTISVLIRIGGDSFRASPIRCLTTPQCLLLSQVSGCSLLAGDYANFDFPCGWVGFPLPSAWD